MNIRFVNLITWAFLLVILTACAGPKSIPTQPPQPPDEYLSNALDWIETHSVKVKTMDWRAVREQALALAPNPQGTADTYPAILFVMEQLGDSATFFSPPEETKVAPALTGITALYPDAIIIGVDPGSPADQAGLQMGDIIKTINRAPPQQWQGTTFIDWYDDMILPLTIRRPGQSLPIAVNINKRSGGPGIQPSGRRISADLGNIGYIELPTAGGDWESYPTLVQQAIREIDRAATCGWIIDLRRNLGGDIWYYIAAMGPILGEGELGGFVYLDGTRDVWKYQDGKVFWNEQERYESLVEGTIYKLKHPMPSVALLMSPATLAAGELAVVTFQGRGKVRTFGEPTGGSPFLVFHTGLSDGSFLGISGAFSMDRTSHIYDGPIVPDEVVMIDWTLFGTERDPAILAAQNWLLDQADCAQK